MFDDVAVMQADEGCEGAEPGRQAVRPKLGGARLDRRPVQDPELYYWGDDNIDYHLKWLDGAKSAHNLTIDYL